MKQKLLSLIILYLTLAGTLYAQVRQVSGTVRAESDGSPLTGVSVVLQGTSTATQTDASGHYVLSVPENATLVFSYVGFTTQQVEVGSRTALDVQLQEDQTTLNDVVVVAYGEVKKTDFTGSATTVTAADLDKRPISNPLVALQGAGTGVQTTVPSGDPGSSPGIRVRGIGSYSASSSALVVVDGVEFTGGLTNINPEDVESITVLKDAATIALFGSRGANGVVMVTTKKGKVGENQLNVKVQMGTNVNATPNYNTVSAGEYYELMWQAYKNSLHYGEQELPMDIAREIASGTLPRNADGMMEYNGESYRDIVQWLGNYNAFNVPNTELISTDGQLNPNARLLYPEDLNWLEQASKTGSRNEYGITYSGGFNKTNFYASLNYLNEEGWGLNSTMDRFAGRVNVNSEIKDWLKAGINFFANHNKYNNASTGSNSIVNPFYFSRRIAPIYPVHLHDPQTGAYIYDEFGEKIYDLGNMVADYGLNRIYSSGRHAIAENLWNLDRNTRDFVGARAYFDIKFLPWLTFNASFSPEITNTRIEGYENTIVGDGAPAGRYSQDWRRRVGYTFNQTLNATRTFDQHSLNVLVGHENFSSSYNRVLGRRSGEGFADFYTFGNFADINTLSSFLTEYAMESYFARANYDYLKRYYLSASVRYDGDSKMPEANRWSTFWSIGAAWRIEQEDFFRGDLFDLLKLRVSYGRLGNNALGDIGVYPYQPGYEIGHNNAAAAGARLESLGSPDLRWEGQRPLDVGVDFSMLQGRIDGSFDYYNRESDGLLFEVPQPYHNGGTTGGSYAVYKNVGNMTNTGIELTITGTLIRQENFNWNLGLNLTTVKNEITKMPEETPEIVSSPYKRQVGKSMYDFYVRSFYGVDPENGAVLYRGIEEGGYDPTNEDIKIVGSDTLTYDHNLARRDFIGKSALPKMYGSIINRFTYKNFDFGFVLMYSMGGYVIDGQYSSFMSAGPERGTNLHKDLLNGWRQPGDVTDIPRMDLSQASVFGATSDRFITKSDYLSLSSVNVSYRLPEHLQERLSIKNARIFLSAENLWFITKRKGLNTLGGFTSASSSSSYSMPRTLNVGVNFSL